MLHCCVCVCAVVQTPRYTNDSLYATTTLWSRTNASLLLNAVDSNLRKEYVMVSVRCHVFYLLYFWRAGRVWDRTVVNGEGHVVFYLLFFWGRGGGGWDGTDSRVGSAPRALEQI